MQTLGDRLKQLRKNKGVSMMTVAKSVGISDAVYCRYEHDISEPTANRIVWLCDYFGVSADYLLGRTDE
ncbi:helix-turn-helix domain-containing protein [Scatolibacter rhodanostii]|uniref:helix-turn-helix domain-containing protein n=1 Tax=Scatolibacter rhodanostii TaxID=2014781 RepID=UPI000C081F44|nr:helix-turn-helix transcriptional regulator [Scatolibacter rhodanostii]